MNLESIKLLAESSVACAGFGALSAVALANPIGAAGGAIYGVSCAVVHELTDMISIKAASGLPAHLQDSIMLDIAKEVVAWSINLFGGWKLAALFGVNISLHSAVILISVAFGMGAATAITMMAASILYKAAKERFSSPSVRKMA